MEDTDKQSLDDIDGGIVHHVGEEGDHPQHKARVNFAEEVKRGRENVKSAVRRVLHHDINHIYTFVYLNNDVPSIFHEANDKLAYIRTGVLQEGHHFLQQKNMHKLSEFTRHK